jgi:hypothetical protein
VLKQVIEAHELLDDAHVNGVRVAGYLRQQGLEDVSVKECQGPQGHTDFIRVRVAGRNTARRSKAASTIGIIGRLGGIGARPERVGLVSDGDGAVAALACSLKLAAMAKRGDTLPGDVIIATHICPSAPTVPHQPVPFMGSPVSMATMNQFEVDVDMEAILSIDTTRGNNIANFRGFAITPTVKEGYILRPSPDLVRLMEWTTGQPARLIPITTQDITPYENGLFHMNSIMQPATATTSPVVGVALTAESAVPGCCTGASNEIDIEAAARYCIEVAKAFTQRTCSFFDAHEFERLITLYGPMNHLQHSEQKQGE